MLFLLACARSPALNVPVDVPVAEHAEEAPAWRFVGPWSVEGLGADVLTGAPRHGATAPPR